MPATGSLKHDACPACFDAEDEAKAQEREIDVNLNDRYEARVLRDGASYYHYGTLLALGRGGSRVPLA